METNKTHEKSAEIKTEVLQICEAFNLGSFKSSISFTDEIDGYILTEFKTENGIYKHYFRLEK